MIAAEDEAVWRAIGDGTRREIVGLLTEAPRTTGEVCAQFRGRLSRVGVMKHLDVLEDAGLVAVEREGRKRWNHVRTAPLERVCGGWIERVTARHRAALLGLKEHVERGERARRQGEARGKRKEGS